MKLDDDTRQILRTCMQNEEDYWNLPMYAMIPDWYLRYWELHNLVLEHFGEEPYEEPLTNFREKLGK